MALGARLLEYKEQFPKAANEWMKLFGDPKGSIFQLFEKYSYKPFSIDASKSTIDPRTYFWMHDFLMEQKSKGNQNVSIVTTWLIDLNELPFSIKANSSKVKKGYFSVLINSFWSQQIFI